MFVSSNSISGILYASTNHNRHASIWLLQGSSSAHACFACFIEQLEDGSILSIRKINILSELLSVLVINENIWDILCQQSNVLTNVLQILLNILKNAKDETLQNIIIELILLICGKTPPFHFVKVCIDKMTLTDPLRNSYYMNLLIRLCNFDSEIIQYLSNKILPFYQDLFQNPQKSFEKSIDIKFFFMLTAKLFLVDFNLSLICLKNLLLKIIELMQSETCLETVTEILATLSSMSRQGKCRRVIFDHEFSKFTTNPNSIVEILKGTLFSKTQPIQTITIQIIRTLADQYFAELSDNSIQQSIIKIMFDKNINEYLLELLISSDETLAVEIFSCLSVLMSSKICSKKGHSVFSVTPVLQTLNRLFSTEKQDLVTSGLSLLNILISSDIRVLPVSITIKILEFLQITFQCKNLDIATQTLNCFTSVIKRIGKSITELYTHTLEYLYLVCDYLEYENAPKEFGNILFESVSCFIAALKRDLAVGNSVLKTSENDCETSENDQDFKMFYFLIDRYLISQAVTKFLPLKDDEFQSIFFKFLLCVVDFVPHNGQLIARKLAESAFIKFIYEFKVKAYHLSLGLNDALAQLLVQICLSLEEDLVKKELLKILFSSFCKLNLPIEEWSILMTSSPKIVKNEFISENRLSVLSLLAYGVMSGNSIIPSINLKSCLENIMLQNSFLSQLCVNGKRYFIYLWVHLDCKLAKDNLENGMQIDFAKLLNRDNFDTLLVKSNKNVAWLLSIPSKAEVRINFVKKFIESSIRDEKDGKEFTNLNVEKFSELTNLILTYKVLDEFIEVLLTILSFVDDSQTADQIIFLIDYFIVHFDESAINRSATFIHRLFLMQSKVIMCTENQMYLFKCFNLLQVAKSNDICEIEMKMFNRACTTVEQFKTPFLLLEAVNTLNLLLYKCNMTQNAMPLSVLIENDAVIREFKKSVFENENLIRNVKSSQVSENISSVILFLFSEIIQGIKLFWLKFENPVEFNTDVFIQLLTENQLPVLLTSALSLWRAVIESNLLTKVFKTTSTDNFLSQKEKDILLICLQNLCFHDDYMIKNKALDCLDGLVGINESSTTFSKKSCRNFWNKKLCQLSLTHLFEDGFDPYYFRLLTFVIHEIKFDEAFIDLLLKFTVNCFENLTADAYIFFQFLSNFIDLRLTQISYPKIMKMKSQLYKIETRLQENVHSVQQNHVRVLYFNNVVFIDNSKYCQFEPKKLFDTVKKIRQSLTDRISYLDDGETDSEGGFD